MYHSYLHSITTPLGSFTLIESNGFLTALASPEAIPPAQKRLQRFLHYDMRFLTEATPLLLDAEQQLNAYFSGQLKQFDLPIQLHGTAFQKAVWDQLTQIPYAQTATYGAIGKKLNQKGARAIGTAVGKNPLPIIVPCHRVLPQNGRIGNFSLTGGSASKAYLLDLEGAVYCK